MKRIAGAMLALVVFLPIGISVIAAAQDNPMGHMPPKVLAVSREYTKPGKSGMQHEKTESLFVQAMMHAKWPTHYLAVESLSGKSRALFFTGYESFAAWEKDTLATEKNAALMAALDHAGAVDGDLLSETDGAVLAFREEYSLRPEVDIARMRYFEISAFQVKQGHDKDWDEIVKLVTAAYKKIPDAHWAAYSAVYGFPDTTYIVFNPMKSLAEVDKNFAANKDFEAAMGEEGMKKLAELSAAAIEMSQTNLFAINPRMSYPADEWVKADPEFWKPKAAAAPAAAKKAAEKPAESH
ncbi:MAG TPA: hypothetical protein VJW96_05795 [Terriglobales bacterium]|jgi:hypothetical protein|nr:hypothetical protein [Terriglobales bacterium]